MTRRRFRRRVRYLQRTAGAARLFRRDPVAFRVTDPRAGRVFRGWQHARPIT